MDNGMPINVTEIHTNRHSLNCKLTGLILPLHFSFIVFIIFSYREENAWPHNYRQLFLTNIITY